MEHLDDLTLNDYLDGLLEPEARAEADAHLTVCVACQNRYIDLRAVWMELESLPEAPLSRDLASAVLAAIAPARAALPVAARWVLAAQALLALVLLIAAGLSLPAEWFTVPEAVAQSQVELNQWWQTATASAQTWAAGWAQWTALISASALSGVGLAAVAALWIVGNGWLLRPAFKRRLS